MLKDSLRLAAGAASLRFALKARRIFVSIALGEIAIGTGILRTGNWIVQFPSITSSYCDSGIFSAARTLRSFCSGVALLSSFWTIVWIK